MGCGYVCPICEGKGYLEDGSRCDYCQPAQESRFMGIFSGVLWMLLSVASNAQYTALVNPMIGTGGHGHTFPGAVLPFGMVAVSPDTRVDGSWDGCSGYHDDDRFIYGFSHTHLSGTGCSDLGDIAWLPVYTDSLEKDSSVLRASFVKSSEQARPGFYQVSLSSGIVVALSAGLRSGYQRYTFPIGGRVAIVLNLAHRDALWSYEAKIDSKASVSGFRESKAWAKKQLVFFHSCFNKTPTIIRQKDDGKTLIYYFEVSPGESILLSTGISPVDVDGARNNLNEDSEHGTLKFEDIVKHADATWNRQLSSIRVDDLIQGNSIPSKQEKYINLYTALYHCFIHPSLYHDADFRYRGRDGKIYRDSSFTNYTVFSLWDTYRSLHPLFNLIDRKHNLDFIQSMLHQYQQVGRLPVWELWGNETDCMIGYHAISVITDAWAKGIHDFDKNLALRAMLDAAESDWRGFSEFRNKGFLTTEDESESVSKSLEYSYNYWCISKFIRMAFGDTMKIPDYIERGIHGWIHLLAKTPGGKFFVPRVNGGIIEPFDPYEVNNHYTEANAWQYKFAMVHDLNQYIQYIGGSDSLEMSLDQLFQASTATTGRKQDDISGLIGQYAHGNEPSHHMAWLYHFTKAPEKGFQKIDMIRSKMYRNRPDGLIGNEDCGQMSAWYVWASLGMYPILPGTTDYMIAPPLFNQIEIYDGSSMQYKLHAGPYFKRTKDISNNNQLPKYQPHKLNYNQRIRIFKNDGTSIDNCSIDASDSSCRYLYIVNQERKQKTKPLPKISLPEPSPFVQYHISGGRAHFKLSGNFESGNKYVYTQNLDSEKHLDFGEVHTDTFSLPYDQSIKLNIYALNRGEMSPEITIFIPKVKNDLGIIINAIPNKQYTAGGPQALIDGQKGDVEWRKGKWQGYQDQDVELLLTLPKAMNLKGAGMNFLQDQRSWIMMPHDLEIWYSLDGVQFEQVGLVSPKTVDNLEDNVIETLRINHVPKMVKYIKMIAHKYGSLPAWHPGKGEPAFIFTDEIWLDNLE